MIRPDRLLTYFVVPVFLWGCIIRIGMEIFK